MLHGPTHDGVVIVDKPEGMSSFAVVKEVRRLLGVGKAGHTGTLDPLATGVLPICLGEATKIAGLLIAEDKEYAASARLGQRTDTLDRDGQLLEERDPSGVTREQVEAELGVMVGAQLQVPPSFSAVRSGGVRAYERARRGEKVDLAARQVIVHRLELQRFTPPDLDLEVACSKGTFIRSIVADLGERLGCGAVVTALRRLRSGPFEVARAVRLDELEERGRRGELSVISIDEALSHLPAVEVATADVARLRQGQPVAGTPPTSPTGLLRLRSEGVLVALGEEREGGYWPKRVFHLG